MNVLLTEGVPFPYLKWATPSGTGKIVSTETVTPLPRHLAMITR
jgi:hypothetical protein